MEPYILRFKREKDKQRLDDEGMFMLGPWMEEAEV